MYMLKLTIYLLTIWTSHLNLLSLAPFTHTNPGYFNLDLNSDLMRSHIQLLYSS